MLGCWELWIGEAEAGGGVASAGSSVTEVASSSVSSFAHLGDDEEAGAISG